MLGIGTGMDGDEGQYRWSSGGFLGSQPGNVQYLGQGFRQIFLFFGNYVVHGKSPSYDFLPGGLAPAYGKAL
ncbi:hypothetical protein ACFLYV_00030 [Chloroflexota bacterium]